MTSKVFDTYLRGVHQEILDQIAASMEPYLLAYGSGGQA
jgi:hypothetical protein